MNKFLDVSYIITLILSIFSLVLAIVTFLGTIKDKKQRKANNLLEKSATKPLLDVIVRVIDVIFTLVGLLVFSPIFILISLSIKICTQESVLVKYDILGRGNRPVQIYKFRTQTNSPDDKALHNLGELLTKTALREIPMMINVLKGDLSVFGLAQIKCNKIEEIEQLVPSIRKAYDYYKPGIVSMFSLTWNVTKKLDDKRDYYTYMNETNVDFLMNRSIRYLMLMQFRTMYLLFKPFE